MGEDMRYQDQKEAGESNDYSTADRVRVGGWEIGSV
jgi:hypothetical protein